jgi:hypothetical protein
MGFGVSEYCLIRTLDLGVWNFFLLFGFLLPQAPSRLHVIWTSSALVGLSPDVMREPECYGGDNERWFCFSVPA